MSRTERPYREGQRQTERRDPERDRSVDRHGRPIVATTRTDSVPRSKSPAQQSPRGSGQELNRGSIAALATSPIEISYTYRNESRGSRHGPGPAPATVQPHGVQGNFAGGAQYFSSSQSQYYSHARPPQAELMGTSPPAQYSRSQPAAPIAAPSPPQNQLSTLGRNFAAIGLGEYEQCESFIESHREITREPQSNFLETAVKAIRENRVIEAQRCIQQVLILRRCEENGRKDFFEDLISREKKTMASFRDDFGKIYDNVKKRALSQSASVQNQPPRSSIPGGSSLTEGVNQMSLTNTAPATRHDESARLPAITEITGPGSTPVNLPEDPPIPRNPGDRTQSGQTRRDSNRASADYNPVLDSRYQVRPSTFFKVGRVFAVIWHVTNTSGESAASDWSLNDSQLPYVSSIHSSPRRMVVVRTRHGRSWCLPVTTYNGFGLGKRGLSWEDVDAHAIIYTSGIAPTYLRGEPKSSKRAIEVAMARPDVKLDVASRVNFASVHTVEHNERVMHVGEVTRTSMPYLETFFQEECDRK